MGVKVVEDGAGFQCDNAVGLAGGGVIAVAGAQYFGFVADLDFEAAADDITDLLMDIVTVGRADSAGGGNGTPPA